MGKSGKAPPAVRPRIRPGIQLDLAESRRRVEDATRLVDDPQRDTDKTFISWVDRLRSFSDLAEAVKVRQPIALVGSALIAKATDLRINPFSLRANAAVSGAYNVRGPAEQVLYPSSLVGNFDIGSNSANPLNGQTFNKLEIVDRSLRLRGPGQQIVEPLNAILHEISLLPGAPQAIAALAAYICVRREYVKTFAPAVGEIKLVSTRDLRNAILRWVSIDSENGGRAQAAVGGLMDAIFGRDRVRVGKTNEPDRVVAGDVIVWRSASASAVEIANEVRDKTVTEIDCLSVIRKLAAAGIRKGVIVAIARGQMPIPRESYEERAFASGLKLTVYTSWADLIEQSSHWSALSDGDIATSAVPAIRARAIEMQLTTQAVSEWDALSLNPYVKV